MTEWVFTHGDSDGVCAGALALAARPGSKVFFTHPIGLLEDLEQVEPGDSVVICDVSLSEAHLPAILARFEAIAEKGSLVYIDHHPLLDTRKEDVPGKVVHKLGSSTSELAYSFFRSNLGPLLSRIAVYGAIADYLDNTPVIREILRNWDKRTIYLETGILVQGLEGTRRDHDFKRTVVRELAQNYPPSFNKRLLKLAIKNTRREETILHELKDHIKTHGKIAYTLNVPFSLGKTAIYARAIAGTPVGLAGESRRGFIDMSLRTGDEDLDLNRLLRAIAPRFGGSGGGHPMAAGARIPEQQFLAFIKELGDALK